jgi:rsbT co-antagonist protein RsbR
MTREEIFAEATRVYDNYVAVLETGSVEALQAYARDLSERIIPRGVETQEVSLFKKYQRDFDLLNMVLDAYEPCCVTPTRVRRSGSGHKSRQTYG